AAQPECVELRPVLPRPKRHGGSGHARDDGRRVQLEVPDVSDVPERLHRRIRGRWGLRGDLADLPAHPALGFGRGSRGACLAGSDLCARLLGCGPFVCGPLLIEGVSGARTRWSGLESSSWRWSGPRARTVSLTKDPTEAPAAVGTAALVARVARPARA